MKTLTCAGGALVLEDEAADAVVRYSLALADRGRTATVTLADEASAEVPAVVVLTVGLGVALMVRGGGSSADADSASALLERLDALERPLAVGATDIDPRPLWGDLDDYGL